MSAAVTLIVLALAVAALFGLLLLEQIRHERRHCSRFCMTCGQYHPKKSTHL